MPPPIDKTSGPSAALRPRLGFLSSPYVASRAVRLSGTGDTVGSHPINLAIRFLLEVSALLSLGLWGWRSGTGWLRFALALLLPIIAATLWGVFAVPGDPSRSGSAPIAVPGVLRLALELGIFALATWALHDSGFTRASWVLGVIVALHYLASYDRLVWLVGNA